MGEIDMSNDIGGNHHATGWSDEKVTADEIEAYKVNWRKHGFPDVDLRTGGRKNNTSLNDPTWRETPEQELWAAVLREAWMDLNPRGQLTERKQDDKRDAMEWLESKRNDEGSFIWICNVFGWDAGYILKQCLTTKPQTEHRGRPVGWQFPKKIVDRVDKRGWSN